MGLDVGIGVEVGRGDRGGVNDVEGHGFGQVFPLARGGGVKRCEAGVVMSCDEALDAGERGELVRVRRRSVGGCHCA